MFHFIPYKSCSSVCATEHFTHKTGEEQMLQLPFQADGPSFPAMAPLGARTLGLLASWLLSFQFLCEGLCWARHYIGLARKFI